MNHGGKRDLIRVHLDLKLDNHETWGREIGLGQLHHGPPSVTWRYDHRPLLPHFSTHILGDTKASSSQMREFPLTPDEQSIGPMVPWVESLEQDAHPLRSLWAAWGAGFGTGELGTGVEVVGRQV